MLEKPNARFARDTSTSLHTQLPSFTQYVKHRENPLWWLHTIYFILLYILLQHSIGVCKWKCTTHRDKSIPPLKMRNCEIVIVFSLEANRVLPHFVTETQSIFWQMHVFNCCTIRADIVAFREIQRRKWLKAFFWWLNYYIIICIYSIRVCLLVVSREIIYSRRIKSKLRVITFKHRGHLSPG